MQFDGDVEEVAQGGDDEVALRHHRGVLVEQLVDSDVVSHLDGNGIDTIVALVGGIVKLLFGMDLCQRLVLSLHTAVEGDGISHFIVELHKVGVFPVDQTLIEIAIRQSDLRSLPDVARLKQFLVIHPLIIFTIYRFTIYDFILQAEFCCKST